MTDENDIQRRLLELAARRFDRDLSNVEGGRTDLFEALDIDSYQAMELLTEIEETFDIEVPDWEVQDVRTFGGLAEVIARRL
ncbi:MAG: acyl carrier protein [Myxococcota bacterium]